MEKFGEIMKSCLNCNDLTRESVDCMECVNEGIHYINWKPVEALKPLPMKENKMEDYEITTQVDGLVHLMRKVDEKHIIKIRVKPWGEVYFEHSTKFSLEVLKRAQELWDESNIELVLPENRIIEVYPYSKEQYYYEGYYITKSFATEIMEESCEKVDEVLSKDNATVRFDGITGTIFDNETQQIPEPTNEQIQNYNTTILKQLAKPHGRTHYYKFTLDFCEDYSIRFFLEFSDRKDYEQNWYLKSHKLKEHTLLTKEMAEDLIRKSCTTFVEEIIGRRSGKKYEKIVVSKDKLVKFTE